MAVETGQAIIAAIYSRVTGDSSLQTTLGGTFALYRWPNLPNDPPLPYFSHRLEAVGWPLCNASYWLDLFCYGDDSAVSDAAIERVRTLLENWRITTGDSEIGAGRMLFVSAGSGYIPTNNPLIWHYSTSWQIACISSRLTELVG